MPLYQALATVAVLLTLPAGADTPLDELTRALSTNDRKAVKTAEERLLGGSASLDELLKAGMLLAQHEMLSDGAVIFKKCSELYPQSFEAKYNLALAQIGLNDYASAERALQGMPSVSARETAAVAYLWGKVFSASGRPQQARQSFEKAYRGNPNDENYALDLALVYIQSSAYVLAINVLRTARRSHPESTELALELALSEALSGQSDAAIALCREMSERDSSLATARLIAAFAQCFAGNYPACEAEASAGLSLAHANPYLYYLHAEALWNERANDNGRILNDLHTAIGKMPQCGVCLLLRSRVLEAAHNNNAAMADIRAALAADPRQAQAWYLLAMLYRKSGQGAAAAGALEQYRALQNAQTNDEIESFRKQFIDK